MVLHGYISTVVAELAHLNFVGRLVRSPQRPRVDVLRVVVGAGEFSSTNRTVSPILVEFEQLRLRYWGPFWRFLLSLKETLCLFQRRSVAVQQVHSFIFRNFS